MRWFVLLATLPLLIGCDRQLSKTEFRDLFIEAYKERQPDASVTAIGDLTVVLKDNDNEARAALDSGYAEYLGSPPERDLILDKWVSIAVQSTTDRLPSIERDGLVYVLRHKDYMAQIPQPNDVISRPFGGDLIQLMMLDSPTALMGVSLSEIQALGVSTEEAWAIASDNLKVRMGPIQLGDLNGNGPFAYGADSGLATGLLAHPDECGPAAIKPEDGRIVLVLDRNTWISTLPADPLSVERFWTFAKPYLGKAQLMSDIPLTCRNGKWEETPIPQ